MGKIKTVGITAQSAESQTDETNRFEKAPATVRQERVERERTRLKRQMVQKNRRAAGS